MGLYFRKRIKILPGVHMNVSKSGTSWSIGPRGAKVNFGKRGTYVTTGIPAQVSIQEQKFVTIICPIIERN